MSANLMETMAQQIRDLQEELARMRQERASNAAGAAAGTTEEPVTLKDLVAELRSGEGKGTSCKEPGMFNGDRARVAHFCVEVRHVFESQPSTF